MRTPEESARQVLRGFAALKRLRVGGAATYETLAVEIPDGEDLDTGLRYTVALKWLQWTPIAKPSETHLFTLTESGYQAAEQALRSPKF